MSTINLHNADCMEFMRNTPDKAYGLAIVDPPYGIGDTWSKNRSDRFYHKGKMHSYQNESSPEDDYFAELQRVSENQIIWGGNYFTKRLLPSNAWIIWNKGRNADVTYMSEAELAWTSFKKVLRIADFLWDGARKCENVDKYHPHQKPVALYKWLLKNYAKPGDKILDTHGGSMSIAIACYDMGFDLDLCEIDEKYFAAGKARVERHIAQCRFFEPGAMT